MKTSASILTLASRDGRLAGFQVAEFCRAVRRFLPETGFEIQTFPAPPDRDQRQDLRNSGSDSSAPDLDEAVIDGGVDGALFPAEKLQDPVREELDWFWVPGSADPRDVCVLRTGETLASLGPRTVIGVSSTCQQTYCNQRFPDMQIRSMGGDIEERLAKLDAGGYDMIMIAAADLDRLGLAHRKTEILPEDALPTPAGQGHLAVTFRVGNETMIQLRNLFVKSVGFVGAGCGSKRLCTVAGMDAIENCEICLYDALAPEDLLERIPDHAEVICVGKKCGAHTYDQRIITDLICTHARRGKRLVRLKGGDPGIFGRLAEEVQALERLRLPYYVIPGVSSLTAATTGTGLLLTRRGTSPGFAVMTARKAGRADQSVGRKARAQLPLVAFMGTRRIDQMAHELLEEGAAPETPVAVVYDAGSEAQKVVTGCLGEMREQALSSDVGRSGIVLVGAVAASEYLYQKKLGALQGMRVLVTCSEELQDRACRLVLDYGGVPVARPLVRMTPDMGARASFARLSEYDWLVLTSPAAVTCLMAILLAMRRDVRSLPKILTCGRRTSEMLATYHLQADAEPETDFSTDGMVERASRCIPPGSRIIRCISDRVGREVAVALERQGNIVEDCVLYHNTPIHYEDTPQWNAAFFASPSAVDAFVANWGPGLLREKPCVVLGGETRDRLSAYTPETPVMPEESTVEGSMAALAAYFVRRQLLAEKDQQMRRISSP
ncbi:MAG: uroporphyrinogen-III C-methyltransferase [Candidatus Latescibacterota bacterium]